MDELKIYEGLVKGNAEVGYGGLIVAGKDLSGPRHPYLVKKDAQHLEPRVRRCNA